ncbi:MAG: hypothetical protein RI841_12065 [Halomonas sp.]|uniref:hypothetical protein n=1 Tax=Halomonas sp. TaxID=1486246 RepID=UPI00287093A0|nr:hypothetical protein [Halomonas sp.]MDR9440207.1 hypothetical protein [Halomonas sp.]
MRTGVTSLLFFSMMTFAVALHAQDASSTNPRLASDKIEDTKQFPDSVFNKREQPATTLPEDKRKFPDSVFDEKRPEQLDQRQWPDSVFDEKRRSP